MACNQNCYTVSNQAIDNIITSASLIIVSALNAWTDAYLGLIQGLCFAFLLFAIICQCRQDDVRPKLLKRICLLYCNMELRRLFIPDDYSATSIFTNILLAIAIAVLMIALYDDSDAAKNTDLQLMLNSLLYLYSNTMDFSFEYGTFKITTCAFGMCAFFTSSKPPENKIMGFIWNLLIIINTNLLSTGIVSMIQSPFIELEFLEILTAVCILRLLLPSMESYLAYLAALQLATLIPGMPTVFFCAILWINILPLSSQRWIGEMCCTYIIASITASIIRNDQIFGMIPVLVLTHYIDYIIETNK